MVGLGVVGCDKSILVFAPLVVARFGKCIGKLVRQVAHPGPCWTSSTTGKKTEVDGVLMVQAAGKGSHKIVARKLECRRACGDPW